MPDNSFWDSNLWVYLFNKSQLPADIHKAAILSQLMLTGNPIFSSAQVLNEASNVLMKKYGFDENRTLEVVERILLLTENCLLLTPELTREALRLKQKYGLSFYDSLVLAAALALDCEKFHSEDLQNGLVIEGKMMVVNPFG